MHFKIKELHKLITTLKNEEGLSDYGTLLLEGYATGLQTVVKENCNLQSVSGSASCECPQKHLKHINDQNSYPHGEWIEYDQCTQCGKIHNMKVH